MGQIESAFSRDINCDIPILQSCYQRQIGGQQGTMISDTNLRNSLMFGIVRKAYDKLHKINESRMLQSSNNQPTQRIERKAIIEKENQFKHSSHANIYMEQKYQLQRLIRGVDKQSPNTNTNGMKSFQSQLSNMSQSNFLMTSIYENPISPLPQTQRKFMEVDFEKQILSLPNDVLFHVISFIMLDYSSLIQVGSLWYLKIHQAVDSYLLKVDNQFIKMYMKDFSLKNAFTSYSNYRITLRQGFRLDRNIVAEILPQMQGKIVTFDYEFNFLGQKERKKHSFRFIVQRNGTSRTIWINMDQCSNNYDVRKQATLQPVLSFCVGDNIKIGINIFNLSGIVDMESLKFSQASFENIPTANIFQTHKSMRIPTSLEPPQADWVMYEYSDQANKVVLDHFQPQLILKESRCRGSGIVVSKMVYSATQIGSVINMPEYLNINVLVKRSQDEITNEVKRVGLVHDLDNTLQLRQGDKLIIYYSKGGSEY